MAVEFFKILSSLAICLMTVPLLYRVTVCALLMMDSDLPGKSLCISGEREDDDGAVGEGEANII